MHMEKWATSYSEKVYDQKRVYLWDSGTKTLLTRVKDVFLESSCFLRRYPATKKVVLITKSVETKNRINQIDIIVTPLWRFLLLSDTYLEDMG